MAQCDVCEIEIEIVSVPRGTAGCTCGTPPFAPREPAHDCPFHAAVQEDLCGVCMLDGMTFVQRWQGDLRARLGRQCDTWDTPDPHAEIIAEIIAITT